MATWPLLERLLLAALLGGIIGFQRQASQKAAGFRTHLLVALGCCAFTVVSTLAGDTRIAANILTGIGFIGAGVIFRSQFSAHGLTTAASIWTVAAIGLACGMGTPLTNAIAIATTVLTFCALVFSDDIFSRFLRRSATFTVEFTGEVRLADIAPLLKAKNIKSYYSDELTIDKSGTGTSNVVRFNAMLPPSLTLAEVAAELSALPMVSRVAANEPVALPR